MNKNNLLLWAALGLSGISLTARALTLEETVEQTLRTNPEMLAAIHEYESRKQEVKQAKADYLPHLSVSAGTGEEERIAPATGNEPVELTRSELGLHARQLVFDGFATTAEIARQQARVDSASYGSIDTAESLALRTAEVYLNVLRHAELMELTQESLWEHQNIHDQMKLRSQTGVGSKADLDQIAARLALANANLIVAKNNLADAQTNFYRVTAVFPQIQNMARPNMPKNLPADINEAVDLATERHPVLLSAKADVEAAQAQYKASASRFMPRLDLEVDKRWDEDIGGIEGEDEDLIFALRLTYDLYSGGANKARRKQTASLLEQAREIRNNSRRQAVESMQLSWNAYEALSVQIDYLQAHVKAAQSTKEAYAKQFNIGRRTLLDLLNTETEVVEARRSLINAEYDRLFSSYRIFKASGRLLGSLGVKP